MLHSYGIASGHREALSCGVTAKESESETVRFLSTTDVGTATSLAQFARLHFSSVASLSICSAFQCNHFSSMLATAAFCAFLMKLFLRVRYQSWYPFWSVPTCVLILSAMAVRQWNSIEFFLISGVESTISAQTFSRRLSCSMMY